MQPNVTLISCDELCTISVNVDVVNVSPVLMDIVSIVENTEITIPLPNIDSEILPYIVKYMTYHSDISHKYSIFPQPLIEGNIHDHIVDWDKDFIFNELMCGINSETYEYDVSTVNTYLVHKFVDASDFLAMTHAVYLCSACLAAIFYGKSPPSICKILGKEPLSDEIIEKQRNSTNWSSDLDYV